jgi:serine phosphatase RsbU (regulator of sigma subunit)/putative methionine-R-sulfoxide reductase with GAF domain
MNDSGIAFESLWKQFLSLGEELLRHTDPLTQTRLICEYASERLACQARVWLASPFYPLPAEPEMETLPAAEAPTPVKQAFARRQMVCENQKDGTQASCKPAEMPETVAIPLLSQEAVLGILLVERPAGPGFTELELEFLSGISAHAALNMQYSRQVTIKNYRYEQLALVRSVSEQVANILDPDELCRRVTRLIQETFNHYYVAIFTLQNDTTLKLRAGASYAETSFLQPDFTLTLGHGLVGHTAQTGEELLVPDVRQEPRYQFVDTLPVTRSEAVLPLQVEGHILGVLDVQSDQLNAFHDIDMIVLRALADNIALALEGIHRYRDLQHNNEQISAVFELSHAIGSILDLDTLLDEVVRLIHARFGYPFVHIFTVHPGRQKIIYRTGHGARSRAMRDKDIQYDIDADGIIPWVARTGKIKLANDVEQEPLYRPSPLPPKNTRSELSVPLVFGRDVLGVLDIQSDRVNAFNHEDLSLFNALSGTIATAIRNATLYRSERWRRQVSDSLRDVAGLISANVELDTLLDRILTELERNLPSQASAIWLIDDQAGAEESGANSMRLAAAHGVDPEKVTKSLEDPKTRGWLTHTLNSKRPIIRRSKDPIGPLGVALGCSPEYSSVGAVLRAGDRDLGILALAHSSMGRYGSESQAMTAAFANYAAVAIQNARLYVDAQTQAWISTVLLQVAEASQSSDTVEDLLETMVRLIPLLIGVKKCAIFLWDENRQVYVLKSWYGIDFSRKNSVAFSEELAPAFIRLRQGQGPIYIENAAEELNLPNLSVRAGAGTLLMLPLIAHSNLLGAFLISHESNSSASLERSFDQQTLLILQGMVHQSALALENLSLLEARQEEGYVTAVMLQVAEAVASQNELNDVLDTIVHLMPILVGIDACVIYLWDDVLNEFFPTQAFSLSGDEEELLMDRSFSPQEFDLLDRAFAENRPLFSPVSDASIPPDEWPDLVSLSMDEAADLSAYANSTWITGYPLSVKGEVYGVLVAKDTGVSPAFRERRREILSGVAQQVAMAIQNDRLTVEMLERERMDREFQLARQIQQTFLPSFLPSINGWELDARWQTARSVGGDFYDIFRVEKNRYALVIADVSDKGMPAALYMTVTRTLIRANARSTHSPAHLLEQVNNMLMVDAQNGMYVTAIYALLDVETGKLTYSNAGHNQPLIIYGRNGKVERLHRGGMALAVMNGNKYVDHELTLQPDDCLLLYTDGVTEQFAPSGDVFGEERLIDFMSDRNGQPVRDLVDSLFHALIDFRQGDPPSDDVTVLTMRRLAESKPVSGKETGAA